jgi:hypothetical protein
MGALTVFAYIVSVAITKNPLGLVSLLSTLAQGWTLDESSYDS